MYSPTLDEFLKLAAQGNVIPVTRRLLADIETPLSAYRKIRGQGESFLFESVEGGDHLGRYSFVGCNPRAVIKQTGHRVEVIENGRVVETFVIGRDTLPRVQADRQVSPTGSRKGQKRIEAEQRQARSRKRREIQERLAAREKEIAELEAREKELTADLEKPETYAAGGRAVQINREQMEIHDRLAAANAEWEKAGMELAEFEAEADFGGRSSTTP